MEKWADFWKEIHIREMRIIQGKNKVEYLGCVLTLQIIYYNKFIIKLE